MSAGWAAIAAARGGARVILVDKGFMGTSGVTATAGPNHWWVPPDPVLREAAIDKRHAAGLGLADRGNRYPTELSGGERQRVAIARAVVGDRRLLLADEPSGALDSVNAEAVMRLIHEACKRGVAAVVVTHDAQLASWADRVVFLRDGRVVDQTAPLPGPESLLTPGQTP